MEDITDGAWGQLVSVTDVDSPHFPLIENRFTVGRAKDCDISLTSNKLVSGRHCHIERDAEGRVWLCDTSTNGTLLNTSEKITKGNRKELTHGDEFFVVYKKDEEDINVGYMYQNLEELQKEMDATQDYSLELEMEATLVDDSVNIAEEDDCSKTSKRSAENTSTCEPLTKRLKTDDGEQGPSSVPAEDGKGKITLENKDDVGKSSIKEKEDQGKTTPEVKDGQKETTSEDKKDCCNKPGMAATSGSCVDGPDEIEEALICTICQELLHDCISLQPCMHSFCAGCYSDWMEKSNECPTCRMKVERINKNHIVNNLMEAYLKENPNKKRDEEDLKELDAKNKISRDMLYPGSKHRMDSSDSSESDSSDSGSPPPDHVPFQFNAPPPLLGFGTPVFGTVRPARTLCRQCPDYNEVTIPCTDLAATTTGTTGILGAIGQFERPGPSGEQPDPDVKVMPTAPDYRCKQNQTHVLCQCCLQPMPDRRPQYLADPTTIPPQQCALCYRAYCHAYWGCKKVDCMGCIGKFRDIRFGKKCLSAIILENQFESQVLKNYLEKKNLSVKYVLDQCLAKVDTGVFSFRDPTTIQINGGTPICYACALRKFKDLAYQYRFSIPRNDLPAEVTSRPDCHWGKNCRTQRHNINHAQRFNHICDQIRLT
ncbi:E3 ubiquitin-protein ligase CHFR-like isoform X2 [Ylistrum balloti]|uniref:E3 ubiquitin-protein ligase CHFR-like isoform X2 n=1 Tax=Ylistrum balloti TaxID=509963 RepID=UPI002905A853|nr:E3 ubiquitin-protein ligase CHFR-like isoform X2 [Ylistrum balloti]